MSIITLKKNSYAKHCRNHSNKNDGFSVWPSINSGLYNGSRLISGFSATQTPFKGASVVNYSGKQHNIIKNCPYPAKVCTNNHNTVLNTKGLLTNKLVGTKYGNLNTVKQYVNNGSESEYIKKQRDSANICYVKSIEDSNIFTNTKKNCDVTSIIIGNASGRGRRILVGNYVKTGALAKQSASYSEYNNGVMKNNCLNDASNKDPNKDPNPLVRLKNGTLVSSNIKNNSSFRNVCPS
tara:strand:+ start:27 stop:737 length:711 start_codon:yes stop_codon:yes gene_type:complete